MASLISRLCQPGAHIITRHEPILVQASVSSKASWVLLVCETGAPRSTSMCLDFAQGALVYQGPTGADVLLAPDTQGMSRCWLRHPLVARLAGADGVPDRCPKQHNHQGPIGADVVPARCPHQYKARVDAGPGVCAQQGCAGADGVRDRCPRKQKHLPRLF